MVFVKGTFGRIHASVLLPWLWHSYHDSMGERIARQVQELERIIVLTRVRCVWVDKREDFVDIVAELVGRHRPSPGVHPIRIPLNCVDLTIVYQIPIRVSPIPTGERVG